MLCLANYGTRWGLGLRSRQDLGGSLGLGSHSSKANCRLYLESLCADTRISLSTSVVQL